MLQASITPRQALHNRVKSIEGAQLEHHGKSLRCMSSIGRCNYTVTDTYAALTAVG